MVEHKTIDLNGIHFHYVEAPGPGPVLVLLHGFNISLDSYLPVLHELSKIAHVYAFDFRGHGASEHTPHQYPFQNHVFDVELFLQTISGTPVILAGHSMGGWVAGWVTARNPDWVQGLIVEDTGLFPVNDDEPGFPDFIPVRDQIIEFKSSGKSVEDFAEAVAQSPAPSVYEGKTRIEVYGKEGAYRHARQRWAMDVTHYDSLIDGSVFAGYNAQQVVPLIQCPTCFITSTTGTPDLTLAAMPGATHVVIDTVDHRVHEMRPKEYAQAVRDFIQRL